MGAQVYVEAYGCTANLADAQTMRALLAADGYTLVTKAESADVHVLVTCTVKTPTAQRMEHRIRTLRATAKPLVVAGCFAQAEPARVRELYPGASLIGPRTVHRVREAVTQALSGQQLVALDHAAVDKSLLPKLRLNPVLDIIQIATGCLSACTFCETKLAKGGLTSYRPGSIARAVTRAVAEGCREIWLTSTDCGVYGFDCGTNLAELLRAVSAQPGEFRVRVGMMNPAYVRDFADDLISAYRSPKIFRFLHLPVQSGSDRILELMARQHTVADFEEIVARFRSALPDLTLSTDIIVGFPTETEEDFAQTAHLMERVKPDIVNISRYGARPRTRAAAMPQVPAGVMKERSRRLTALCRQIAYERNQRWLGWRGEALVDEASANAVIARNAAYKPIVIPAGARLGEFIHARITGATFATLRGHSLSLADTALPNGEHSVTKGPVL